MKKIWQQPNAINLADLNKLVNKNPKYAKMFSGLAQIDNSIKKFVQDIVCNQVVDSTIYYIKTELNGQCYNLYLYNAERSITIGVSWLLVDFLQKCEDKTIEYDVNNKVSAMIKKFNSSSLLKDKTNWIN